jgi:hypothetical protein
MAQLTAARTATRARLPDADLAALACDFDVFLEGILNSGCALISLAGGR